MEYPGLAYPIGTDFLKDVKKSNRFVIVNRNSPDVYSIDLVSMLYAIDENPDLIFAIGPNIGGNRQDVIDALYLAGYDIDQIAELIKYGFDDNNYMSPEGVKWRDIMQNEDNNQTLLKIFGEIPPPRNAQMFAPSPIPLYHLPVSPIQPDRNVND